MLDVPEQEDDDDQAEPLADLARELEPYCRSHRETDALIQSVLDWTEGLARLDDVWIDFDACDEALEARADRLPAVLVERLCDRMDWLGQALEESDFASAVTAALSLVQCLDEAGQAAPLAA